MSHIVYTFVVYRIDRKHSRCVPVLTSVCAARAARLAKALEKRNETPGTEYTVRRYKPTKGEWIE